MMACTLENLANLANFINIYGHCCTTRAMASASGVRCARSPGCTCNHHWREEEGAIVPADPGCIAALQQRIQWFARQCRFLVAQGAAFRVATACVRQQLTHTDLFARIGQPLPTAAFGQNAHPV